MLLVWHAHRNNMKQFSTLLLAHGPIVMLISLNILAYCKGGAENVRIDLNDCVRIAVLYFVRKHKFAVPHLVRI